MVDRVTVETGCRFDLAGGTLDIWPLGLLHRGARTINVAIDVPVRVELMRRTAGYRLRVGDLLIEGDAPSDFLHSDDGALFGLVAETLEIPPVDATLASASPRGGGLGASSAITVALIAAGEALEDDGTRDVLARAELARDIEARLMGLPTGCQDQMPPQLGGALELLHAPGGLVARRLEVDLEALGRCLTIFFTGRSHLSGTANWQVVRRRLEGDPLTRELFSKICAVAISLGVSLEAGDYQAVGRLMGEEWSFRSQLAEGVSTVEIETLLSAATRAGAWGGKAGGAGGGGCVGVLHPENAKDAVVRAVTDEGGVLLDAAPTSRSMVVTAV